MLLLTHSVLGRISSHMIIHRARVCENEVRSEAGREMGIQEGLKTERCSDIHNKRAHQPSAAETLAWWNPVGTKYLEVSANQQWTWRTKTGRDKEVLIFFFITFSASAKTARAEDGGRQEPLDQAWTTTNGVTEKWDFIKWVRMFSSTFIWTGAEKVKHTPAFYNTEMRILYLLYWIQGVKLFWGMNTLLTGEQWASAFFTVLLWILKMKWKRDATGPSDFIFNFTYSTDIIFRAKIRAYHVWLEKYK